MNTEQHNRNNGDRLSQLYLDSQNNNNNQKNYNNKTFQWTSLKSVKLHYDIITFILIITGYIFHTLSASVTKPVANSLAIFRGSMVTDLLANLSFESCLLIDKFRSVRC